MANKILRVSGFVFLFIHFKDKKEHSLECHSIKNTFFLKKKLKVIGFRDFFRGGGGGGGGGEGGGSMTLLSQTDLRLKISLTLLPYLHNLN